MIFYKKLVLASLLWLSIGVEGMSAQVKLQSNNYSYQLMAPVTFSPETQQQNKFHQQAGVSTQLKQPYMKKTAMQKQALTIPEAAIVLSFGVFLLAVVIYGLNTAAVREPALGYWQQSVRAAQKFLRDKQAAIAKSYQDVQANVVQSWQKIQKPRQDFPAIIDGYS